MERVGNASHSSLHNLNDPTTIVLPFRSSRGSNQVSENAPLMSTPFQFNSQCNYPTSRFEEQHCPAIEARIFPPMTNLYRVENNDDVTTVAKGYSSLNYQNK